MEAAIQLSRLDFLDACLTQPVLELLDREPGEHMALTRLAMDRHRSEQGFFPTEKPFISESGKSISGFPIMLI